MWSLFFSNFQQVDLYADLSTNRIFPNNDSMCTWHTVCGILELAVVWVARWGEGRGLWVAHFTVWHTACGLTFKWHWGIGGITETQFRKYQQPLCLLISELSLLQEVRPLFTNLHGCVGEGKRPVCDYFSFLITEHSGWPSQNCELLERKHKYTDLLLCLLLLRFLGWWSLVELIILAINWINIWNPPLVTVVMIVLLC